VKHRIIFYCQPVLGMGHLVRSLAILRGLPDFEIWFVNGGLPLNDDLRQMVPPNVQIVDLPPLQSDSDFQEIRPAGPVDQVASDQIVWPSIESIWTQRHEILLELLERVAPDILLIELYPFGRLKFDPELRPLIEVARERKPTPRIVCSLRDILVTKRDQKSFEEFAVATANQFFDLILIHSDQRFQPIEETFRPLDRLTCRVEYTGYIVPSQTRRESHCPPGEPKIVASIGGGRVGVELLWATISASRLLQPYLPHQLRIFTGPYLPERDLEELTSACIDDRQISVNRFTPDLAHQMSRASLSISLAGYNTCMDIIVAGVPAIVHPFTGNDNLEQTRRARKLAELGLVQIVPPGGLNAEHLAEMMRRSLVRQDIHSNVVLDLGGVEKTSQLLRQEIEQGLY
jgi:predicted glycosyltransferase